MKLLEQVATVCTIKLRLLVCPGAASPSRKLLRLEWCWFVLGWGSFLLPVVDNSNFKQTLILNEMTNFDFFSLHHWMNYFLVSILQQKKWSVYLSSPPSGLDAQPLPSLGTMLTLGSFPLFSAFRLGRLAGGGMRRLTATLPKLWRPCLAATGTNMSNIKVRSNLSTFMQFLENMQNPHSRHNKVYLLFNPSMREKPPCLQSN